MGMKHSDIGKPHSDIVTRWISMETGDLLNKPQFLSLWIYPVGHKPNAMRQVHPKIDMQFYGRAMIVLAFGLTAGTAIILPIYFKLKNGAGIITREDSVGLLRDFLGVMFCMAIFLGFCARSTFRNRKH